MYVTWYAYFTPEEIAKIAALKEGEHIAIKSKFVDCVVEYKNGEYEFEVYDEFDPRDY
jgi:hypothetical protein